MGTKARGERIERERERERAKEKERQRRRMGEDEEELMRTRKLQPVYSCV